MIAYIEDIAQHEGKHVTIRGWLHNRRSSGKIHFLSVRDGTGFIQAIVSKATVGEEKFKAGRSPLAGDGAHRPWRRCAPTAGRPAASSSTCQDFEIVERIDRLPHHAEGARRRLSARPPASVDPLRASARDPARPPRSHFRRPRLFQRSRLHPGRHAHFHAGRLRRHHDAVSRGLLRRSESLPRRRAASSTPKPTPWRLGACTTSARCSAPRNRRRAGI